jgi:hypothetical protein
MYFFVAELSPTIQVISYRRVSFQPEQGCAELADAESERGVKTFGSFWSEPIRLGAQHPEVVICDVEGNKTVTVVVGQAQVLGDGHSSAPSDSVLPRQFLLSTM